MWKILFSELVHEAAVQDGVRIIFLRKSENSDNIIVQCTIGCVRYNVYSNFKGKKIGQDKLHVGDIKKRQLRGESNNKIVIILSASTHTAIESRVVTTHLALILI
jgi:hypothetical protein